MGVGFSPTVEDSRFSEVFAGVCSIIDEMLVLSSEGGGGDFACLMPIELGVRSVVDDDDCCCCGCWSETTIDELTAAADIMEGFLFWVMK